MSNRWAWLIARIFLVLIFVVAGAGKLAGFQGTVAMMASMGLPSPSLLLSGALVLEIAGAILVLLGWKTRLGVILLIVFLIPVTLIFHDFWATPPEDQREQVNQFLKNLSLIGGLVLLYISGPGPVSLDHRRARAGETGRAAAEKIG